MYDLTLKTDIIERFEFIDGHSDIWRLFYDGAMFSRIVAELTRPFVDSGIDKIVGIEARGFILGASVASRMGIGFVAIRKAGGLYPGSKIMKATPADYRGNTNELRLQTLAISPGDRVLIVDDWFETGSQALTAKSMIEECGGRCVGLSIIVDQLSDHTRDKLGMVHAILSAQDLDAKPSEG